MLMNDDTRKAGDPVLGAQLRQMRIEAGLSQTELGERLGLTHGALSRIENGLRSTGIEVIQRWYQECGYRLDGVRVGTAEQATSLALAVADLPQDELDAVIAVVRAWPKLSERDRGRILGIIDQG